MLGMFVQQIGIVGWLLALKAGCYYVVQSGHAIHGARLTGFQRFQNVPSLSTTQSKELIAAGTSEESGITIRIW